MLTDELLSNLCCPTCKTGDLQADITRREGNELLEGSLTCNICNESYPVKLGIPNLMPHGVLSSEEWQMWKDHLAEFQERREQRIKEPGRFVNRLGRKSKAKTSFSQFINISGGKVLDLGCGAGKFRHHLNNIKPVTYYGLDPMVVPDVENFPFVRALAEYMPFNDSTFSDIVITAALDHFKDLDKFFAEAARVLEPNGKLHIMQHVHDLTGPITAVKTLAHWVKDTLEDIGTKHHKHDDVPHHMSEFTKSALFERSSKYFDVLAINEFSKKWYSPTIAFVSLGAKNTG